MSETKNTNRTILRGTSIVSSLTLVSRLLGFVRDLLVARLFGAGLFADAFFVAFRIPNLLRSIFAEGALTSAFVPIFSTELIKGKDDARNAMRQVSGLLLSSTIVLSILGVIFSSEVVHLFAPGFASNPEKEELCILLTQIMFPYIIFVSLVALINGALNSVHVFGASAFAQVWMNLALIIGALIAAYFPSKPALIVLSLSVVVGGIVQVVVQVPALRRAELLAAPSCSIFTPTTRQMLLLMIPSIVGATVYQLQIFLNTLLASLLEDGSVSWLFYADRLAQLPIGIFSIALASVLLPTLSSAAAVKNEDAFSANLVNALRYTSFIIIPTSFILFFFANPLISIIFERGAFSSHATEKTAMAVQAYSVGLWAISCQSMGMRAFFAKKDTVTPTVIGMITLCSTILFSTLFMGPIASSAHGSMAAWLAWLQSMLPFSSSFNLGHAGLALSSSVGSIISLIIVLSILRKRSAHLELKAFFVATLKALLASLGFAAAALLLRGWNLSPMMSALIGIPCGAVFFLLFAFTMKAREASEALELLSSKLKARASS